MHLSWITKKDLNVQYAPFVVYPKVTQIPIVDILSCDVDNNVELDKEELEVQHLIVAFKRFADETGKDDELIQLSKVVR